MTNKEKLLQFMDSPESKPWYHPYRYIMDKGFRKEDIEALPDLKVEALLNSVGNLVAIEYDNGRRE